LKKPQSWVYHCETGNRRVDVTEFVAWARACGADPEVAFARLVVVLSPGTSFPEERKDESAGPN
jgi:hypothetical protein